MRPHNASPRTAAARRPENGDGLGSWLASWAKPLAIPQNAPPRLHNIMFGVPSATAIGRMSLNPAVAFVPARKRHPGVLAGQASAFARWLRHRQRAHRSVFPRRRETMTAKNTAPAYTYHGFPPARKRRCDVSTGVWQAATAGLRMRHLGRLAQAAGPKRLAPREPFRAASRMIYTRKTSPITEIRAPGSGASGSTPACFSSSAA